MKGWCLEMAPNPADIGLEWGDSASEATRTVGYFHSLLDGATEQLPISKALVVLKPHASHAPHDAWAITANPHAAGRNLSAHVSQHGPDLNIRTDEGWLYLADIKDLYTCEIVGYAMAERMTCELTLNALNKAWQWRKPSPGLIHHSNRGGQYCARQYRQRLHKLGMQASMSRPGNCYDNAPMESFWGSLKNELVHHRHFTSRSQAIAEITEWIEIFYNRQRLHTRLGNLSPAGFARRFYQHQNTAT